MPLLAYITWSRWFNADAALTLETARTIPVAAAALNDWLDTFPIVADLSVGAIGVRFTTGIWITDAITVDTNQVTWAFNVFTRVSIDIDALALDTAQAFSTVCIGFTIGLGILAQEGIE